MERKILLAEDDQNFGMMLQSFLQLQEFTVDWAVDGVDALEKFRRGNYHIGILDVMMPDMDGFTLAEEMNKVSPDMPFVFLTAKSMKEDKIKGFKLGAVDYLVKPFDPDILLLKIEAILRQGKKAPVEDDKFTIGNYVFDAEKRSLQLKDYIKRLSPKEAALLQLLAEKKGELLSREEALIKIWKEDTYFTAQSMNVFITKLRKYLSLDLEYLIEIENVHGSGFVLQVNRRG
jgi:two-component system OmpR family response regulator